MTSTNVVATVVVPTSYYAACSSENIALGVWGSGTICTTTTQPYGNYADFLGNSSNLQPYDCCVACQQASGCIWFSWDHFDCYPEGDDEESPSCDPYITSGCAILTEDTCTDYTSDTFGTCSQSYIPPQYGTVLGNGPCGQLEWSGWLVR